MATNNNFGLGGTEVKQDAFEAFADIPANKVLMAEKLTNLPAVKPEIVEGLTDVEAVFAHYKPNVEIGFEDANGASKKENLQFKHLGDFGVKGITAQSPLLNNLNMKHDQYLKIIKQLKTNKMLKAAMNEPSGKENIIAALNALITEMKEKK
jgi:hypothetical protein